MTTPVGSIRVDITVDGSKTGQQLGAQLKKALAETSKHLDKFRAEQSKKAINITVNVDTTAAFAQLEAFRTDQAARRIHIPVDVDVSKIKAADIAVNKVSESVKLLDKDSGNKSKSSSGVRKALSQALLIRRIFREAFFFGGVVFAAEIGTVLADLAQGLQQVAQAGLALPGIFAGASASLGTFAVGANGMVDALKAIEKGAKGTPAALDEMSRALEKLSPNAASVVKTLAGLAPAASSFQKEISQIMFDGISESIQNLVKSDFPVLRAGMSNIASAWNDNLKQFFASASDGESQGILARILGNTGTAQRELSKAIDPILKGIGTLMAASSDALPRIAQAIGAVATRFENFIKKADANGDFAKWIDQGLTGLRQFGNSLLNLGKAFTGITKATGGGFLQWLEKTTDKFQKWVNSVEGQNALKEFFDRARESLGKIGAIIQDLAPILAAMLEAASYATQAWLSVLKPLMDTLAEMPELIGFITLGFLGWKSITTVSSLISGIVKLTGLLRALPAVAAVAGRGITIGLGPVGWALAAFGTLMWAADKAGENTSREDLRKGLARRGLGALVPKDSTKPTDASSPASGLPLVGLPDDVKDMILGNFDAANGASAPKNLKDLLGQISAGAASAAASGPLASIDGENAQITMLRNVARAMGLTSGFTGRESHLIDEGYHPTGEAGDFNGSPEDMARFAQFLMQDQFLPYISELIFKGPGITTNVVDGRLVPAIDMPGSAYTTLQAGDHSDHVHVAIDDSVAQEFMSAISGGLQQGLPAALAATPGLIPPPVAPLPSIPMPTSSDVTAGLYGPHGITSVVPKPGQSPEEAIREAAEQQIKLLEEQEDAARKAKDARDYEARIAELQRDADEAKAARDSVRGNPLAAQVDIANAENKYQESLNAITEAQNNRAERLKQEDIEARKQAIQDRADAAIKNLPQQMNPDDLPYGHPMKILYGILGGAGMSTAEIGALLGGVGSAPIAAATSIQIPGPLGLPGAAASQSTDVSKLLAERNPLAVAAASGLDVPDYSRAGAGASAAIMGGASVADALGRMYADTSALIDRTSTNQEASAKARHDQIMTVLSQLLSKLGEPLQAAVQAGTEGGITATTDATSQAIGQAVQGALPGGLKLPGMAAGGAVTNGIAGVDSVPTMLMPGEHVLTVPEVTAMGGHAAVTRFRAGVLRHGLTGMATGGPVNSVVGADLLGVSQVPVVGAMVNVLVEVLLQLIGVQIEARDTMTKLADDFKGYRGEFAAADSAGRLYSDTSGLTDRTSSSTQESANERLRVLKLVLDGLVKYVIEQVIVPIAKAVGNALLQAGAGALQGGLTATFPGGSVVGSIIGNALTTGGSAGIDIASEFFSKLAQSAISSGLGAASQLLPSLAPGLTGNIFGGSFAAQALDPLTKAFTTALGGLAVIMTSIFGDAGTFDSGGVASGTGLMRKATIKPERVLSPSETQSFEKLVEALSSPKSSAQSTTIYAPMTITGGKQVADKISDKLLALAR